MPIMLTSGATGWYWATGLMRKGRFQPWSARLKLTIEAGSLENDRPLNDMEFKGA